MKKYLLSFLFISLCFCLNAQEYNADTLSKLKKQKKLFTQISALTKKIHLLSFEDQKIAHDEIAKLQEEIFSEVP